MCPIIHVFYCNETRLHGFQALILYPMANGFTDCVLSRTDGIDMAMSEANQQRHHRSIDGRTPILAHKVTRKRIEEISLRVRG